MTPALEKVARALFDNFGMTEQESRMYAAVAVQALLPPSDEVVKAMDLALAAWRRTLDRDEAMMRSYRAHDRKFIASATPAEKHAIRFTAAINSILGPQ